MYFIYIYIYYYMYLFDLLFIYIICLFNSITLCIYFIYSYVLPSARLNLSKSQDGDLGKYRKYKNISTGPSPVV